MRMLSMGVAIWGWNVFATRLLASVALYTLGPAVAAALVHWAPLTVLLTAFCGVVSPSPELAWWRVPLIRIFYDPPAAGAVVFWALAGWRLNQLFSAIDDVVLLGAMPLPADVPALAAAGVKGVVNMCGEYSGPVGAYADARIEQLYLPTADMSAPLHADVERAVAFIARIAAASKGAKVFVHCKCGMGRSATIVLCHLLARGQFGSAREAFAFIKERRPEASKSILAYPAVRAFAKAAEAAAPAPAPAAAPAPAPAGAPAAAAAAAAAAVAAGPRSTAKSAKSRKDD